MSGGYRNGMESIDLEPAISGEIPAVRAGLRLAVAAYLARYKGQSARTRTPTCAACSTGAKSAGWTR
jgi:hypothetical protein